MEAGSERNPLLAQEDWWTVWFGLAILLVATILGALALSGAISATSVAKVGRWGSNPLDVLYRASARDVTLAADATLADVARAINEATSAAEATVEPADGGVRLRVRSTRDDAAATISVAALLAQSANDFAFAAQDPDPGGLGARAYVSRGYPDPDAVIGAGRVTVTAQRTRSIVWPLVATIVAMLTLTAVGVRVMGGDTRGYAVAFVGMFALAVIAYTLANYPVSRAYGIGYAAWALALGLLISNTIGTPTWLRPGVRTEMYIKTGLVLLGAEILFAKILSIGAPGLLVAWVVTPIVIVFMWLFGTRVLNMVSKPLVMIIAAATSVCGVSAAIAAAAATRARKEELTLAVGMTLIFTVLMMIFMPMFIQSVGMGEVLGGAWMGGTIDSTGAVVAAGAFLGARAEAVAAVVKMIQNILIGVVGFALALFWVTSIERRPDAPRPGAIEIWVRFPKFIVGFVAASLLFSFALAPLFAWLFAGNGVSLVESAVIRPVTNPLRGWFFCLAFVAIGLESDFAALARQMEGGKPMALYVVGQSFNLVLTLLMAYLAFVMLFPEAV